MPPYQVFCDPMVLRRIFSGLPDGRGMTTVDEISLSPASDCNSNNVAGSYNSTTSDAEFVQDNSDYQWFTEYGYSGREFCHRSVLSSGYDELARDLDSQLALADMEDFSAQEILSTLPTICCTEIQPERQGEMYASVSGSMMDESVSVSMSEPLFSPIKENPLPCTTNYSVDSLDCDCEDLVLTCQATNKDNYTIAFHGSGEGGDSLYFEERERGMAASTTTWSKVVKPRGNQQRHKSKAVSLPDLPTHPQHLSNSIAALGRCVKLFDIQNSGSLTSESYSGSGGDINSCFNKQENFSLLKLFIAQRNQTENTHNDNDNRNNNPADWEESGCQYEDSLVKGESSGASTEESSSVERLFSECKSDSVCTCSMSSSSHKYNVNNNDSFEKDVVVKKHNVKVGTSTSDLSSATTTSNTGCNTAVRPNALQSCPVHCVDRSMQTSHRSFQQPTNKQQKEEAAVAGSPVYVFYPNYTLPDLAFLHHHKVDLDKVLLTPLKYSPNLPPHPALAHHKPLPRHHVTRHDIEQLKQKGLGHVMDWSSLTPLLPSECWSVLAELPQLKRHSHSRFDNLRPQFTVPATKDRQSPVPTEVKVPKGSVDSGVSDGTSGYRGSSTLLSESSETKQSNPLYVYDYSWTNEPVTPHKLKSNPELNKIDNKEKRLSMFEFTASILDDVFENNSVSKFLKGHNRKLQDHQKTPPNSPINQKSYQVNPNNLNDFYLGQAERIRESPDYENRKESLVEGVVCGVERLLSQRESAAEAALGTLCPALYALMSDGLKTNIDTPFGPINNSVWQVVEASAHQGLVTKALNDLVMKLNCEDVLSEGLIKFNAFIFGLLNVGGVEAWVSYMRTRESVLRKHYNPESVLLQASQGQALSRALTDRIISGLRPLSQIHFSLDLLYETKLLHTSLLQLMRVPVSPTGSTDSESALVRKIVQSLRCCGLTNQTCSSCEQNYEMSDRRRRGVRPRSCIEVVGNSGEAVGSSRKRWSGVAMGSRLASAFDSLAEGSSPSSSPEESTTQQNHGTGKFKSLQRKWELLSNKTSICSPPSSPVKTSVNTPGSAVKSRIPRPVTSPVRPDVGRSRIPRASRADGVDRVAGVGRPSSLPQSRGPPPSHPSTTRRAASSSSTRPSKKTQPPNNRYVVTLSHRLPSDSGHLAFNEGERLRLVLEVDDTWLLCCRGDRKGLVPRSAVI